MFSAIAFGSRSLQMACRGRRFATFAPPRLFDYDTITKNLAVTDAIDSVEAAFGALAKGKVDVPMPMHIGIDETDAAGPGDCHIKGGYVSGTKTFTVKLACVSFYKNVEKGLPPGSGVFVVVDAVTGAPLAIFQENRFMTDCKYRTNEYAIVLRNSIKQILIDPLHQSAHWCCWCSSYEVYNSRSREHCWFHWMWGYCPKYGAGCSVSA